MITVYLIEVEVCGVFASMWHTRGIGDLAEECA